MSHKSDDWNAKLFLLAIAFVAVAVGAVGKWVWEMVF
jgi:hypothetical protein